MIISFFCCVFICYCVYVFMYFIFLLGGLNQHDIVASTNLWRLKLDEKVQQQVDLQLTSVDGTYVYPKIFPKNQSQCLINWEKLNQVISSTYS